MRRSEALGVAKTMRLELQRAMRTIGKRKPPRAYYLSHLLRHQEQWSVRGKFGTLVSEHQRCHRNCFADVRVGSYRYDQVSEGGLLENSKEDESYDHVALPVGLSEDGLRHGLWKLTDARYREAVERYLTRKSHELTYVNRNSHLSSFEKRKPRRDIGWRKLPEVDLEYWRRYVVKASTVAKEFREIKDAYVEFQATNVTRIFVSSEGALSIDCVPYWRVEIYLWLLSAKGDAVPWTHTYLVTNPDELPGLRALKSRIKSTIARMNEVAAAPMLRSFAGPVLLNPIPAGLLLHEALGHRLEGDRLLSSGEGQTFRDAVGQGVLPARLTMRDDPRLESYNDQSLVGHYGFDDQGVPATCAELITDGKLKGFLSSRNPLSRTHQSNGHARARLHERPMSRMGVTIIEAEDGLSDRDMKKELLEEIRRQEVPYGIRIVEANSGETSTESYNFQAFLGEVSYATRVFPDGREEVIRGIDFVGTPLNAIRSIIAAGDRCEVDNGYCGAESGFVPVSTVSPSLLVGHLELQSKAETPYTQYVYPIPW